MNEWSPGGTYRPVTPNQQNQMRSFRSPWEDDNIDKPSAKPLVVNIRTDNRNRITLQQRPHEELSKTSLPAANRIKKTGNGSSDPRFKRVISPGAQNDACVGTEAKISKPSIPTEADEESNFREWNPQDKKSKQESNNPRNNDSGPEFTDVTVLNGNGLESVQDRLKNVDKFSFHHDIAQENFAKQSLSDCTINTRNTSLVSEDLGDDYADRLHSFSSTTRVKKVQNWIADQKPKLDKRQSVITVIGQTQGQGALSSALHEIDQRRKLVKELDKYAICSKITDSDKDKEMSTLVAQINFLSPSGKLLYSKEKRVESTRKSPPCRFRSGNGRYPTIGDKSGKRLESSYDDRVQCDNEANTERDTSISPSSEGSSNHNQKQSNYTKLEDKYDIKGKIRRVVSRIPHTWLPYFMIFLSGTLCWYSYLALQRNGFFIFDMFPQKPKTPTWYERICYWIWEIFRPSGNVSFAEVPTFLVMEFSLIPAPLWYPTGFREKKIITWILFLSSLTLDIVISALFFI